MDPRVPETMINSSVLDGSNEQAEQDPKPKHHGGSFGNYMAYKNQKLHEQFNANAAVSRQSNLFQGVGIYVNGWTSPSHSELKQIMATHGGRFENYYSRSTVTHIICTNLPDAKVKHFEKERSPTPVVRPEWIVESIKAGKLLPITEYMLWQLRGGPGQRTLQDTFIPAGAAGPEAAVFQPPQPPRYENVQPAAAAAAAAVGPSTSTRQMPADKNDKKPYAPAELAAAHGVAAQMRADCDNLKGPPRSSKDDPHFVESFYRASRLHFIGTWKARLEALMASSVATEAPAPAPYILGGGGGGGGYGTRVILHLDMDCFFASVAEAGHPEFKGKPLAVCHSNSARGSGEISSANYEARKHGVGASMFISRAKELCPGIIVVPYEFDKYEVVSEKVYRILLKYTQAVQPVSCDEAFLDITGLGDPEAIAASIRNDIFKATQCTASAGIGPNILLARIATRKAKPNGVFNLLARCCDTSAGKNTTTAAASILPFLAEFSVEDLPGVGWSTKRKLEELGITTVADIHSRSKSTLQSGLGANAGALLWDFAHGRDSRRVEGPKPRRSVGAEVNWGVRFETPEDPGKFVASLAVEVATRMQQGGVHGRTITLKLKRKKPGWTEPVKYLGMGACDSLSKSVTLASMTAAAEDLEREGKVLLRMLRVPFNEIRGMGLAVTRLDTGGNGVVDGGGGGGGIDAAVTGGGTVATAVRATAVDGPSAGGDVAAIEGSEASDVGWELDSESDVSRANVQQPPGASPLPSPTGRGTKRKSPNGGKQASLLDMMPPPPPPPRMARLQEHEEVYEEGNARVLQPPARRELLAKYEGFSLTQIDADELATLPYQLQKELVSRLPRTRQNSARNRSNNTAGGGSDISRKPPPAAPPAAAAVPAVQEPSGSNKSIFSAGIEPLPAFSQIDKSVLDALPLQLRRELETAYGMKPSIRTTDTTAPATGNGLRQHHRQYHTPPKHAPGVSKAAQHDSKLRRLDAFVKPKNGPMSGPIFPSNRRQSSLNITLSQIDPSVLHELPRELQDEVLRQLQPFPSRKSKAATGGARKAVEARTAAAEASRQRQQLEDLQAAQVEGASLDDEDENIEKILQGLERAELPPAVEALVQLANADANSNAAGGGGGATVAEILESLSAAIEEINELDIPSQSQPSQSTQSITQSNEFLLLLPHVVMAAISRGGKNFISHDLEGTRKLLMSLKRIGKKYPSFFNATEAVIQKLQNRVQRRYGWPVSLTAIL